MYTTALIFNGFSIIIRLIIAVVIDIIYINKCDEDLSVMIFRRRFFLAFNKETIVFINSTLDFVCCAAFFI